MPNYSIKDKDIQYYIFEDSSASWSHSTNFRSYRNHDEIHVLGVNTNTNRLGLIPNNNVLFLPYAEDWCIEFNFKSENILAFYFIQDLNDELNGSSSITYGNIDFSKEYSIKFQYSHQNQTISYFMNNNLKVTLSTSFTNDIGFRIIDWQGDMNITVYNLKVY